MPIQASVTQFSGGVTAYNNPTIDGVSDYLYWMCGKFALEAQVIFGGVVNPVPQTINIYPFVISGNDFALDGVSYNNPDIVGDKLMIYVNQYSANWYTDSQNAFIYTATGIKITLPGFNAFSGNPQFSVVLQTNNI